MRTQMRETLTGKTVSGTYSYHGTYHTTRETYTIRFINENYCHITLDDDEYGVSEYDNVPYEITGGVFGLKFNWDKDIGPYHSVEPFEIDSSSGSIEMYTPNFNSHTSMSMDEE
jgi:predicted dehydrogenase